MLTVQHGRTTYFWNGFAGFFFVPVGPEQRERIIKKGTVLDARCGNLPAIRNRGLTSPSILRMLSL